jgi:Bifunctional DNA primase/polymerase, N-terminal
VTTEPRDEVAELRRRLRAAGFSPLPISGKRPPIAEWQTKLDVTADEIALWSSTYRDAASTGVLTRHVPVLDIDILFEEAAEAVEMLIRERFEEGGRVLVRVGRAPKRAIPFRTDGPFKKITANLTAPNGSEGEKIELLCDGQQLVAFGVHPDIGKPYRWFGGEPGEIKRADLPCIHEVEARQLVEDAAELLCRDFGYTRAAQRPRTNGADTRGAADWGYLAENIRVGRELHDSLCDLAAKLVASGMDGGAAVNFLRGLMDTTSAPYDERWKERYADIPRLVQSAEAKQEKQAQPPLVEPAHARRGTRYFSPLAW